MAEAPPSWQHWRPSAAQRRSRTSPTSRRDTLVSSTTKPASDTWIYSRGIEEHEIDLSEIFEGLNVGRSLSRTGDGPFRRWPTTLRATPSAGTVEGATIELFVATGVEGILGRPILTLILSDHLSTMDNSSFIGICSLVVIARECKLLTRCATNFHSLDRYLTSSNSSMEFLFH